MKFAVMGAGAIGCYFGGLLARAGDEVTLIGRQRHVDPVNERGLILEIGKERFELPLHATTDPAGVAGADVVLVAVKSGDTESVAREIAPHLRTDAVLLSLQNGVDNAERLAAIVARPVAPVAVYVATQMAGPGHVKHFGRGELVMGHCPREAEIVAHFARAGIPLEVSDNAVGTLWGKLVVNCAYNPLSAITGLPYGPMLRVVGMEDLMREVVTECSAVAKAAGVSLSGDVLDATLGLAATMPGQSSSTAQDLAAKRPTEIDHLNGFIARKGAELGIPTPVNRALHTLVKALEAKAGVGRPEAQS